VTRRLILVAALLALTGVAIWQYRRPTARVAINWGSASRQDLITAALDLDVQEGGPRLALRHLTELAARDTSVTPLGHIYAHDLGRYALHVRGIDAFAECTPQFESGCYHGMIEAYVHDLPQLGEVSRVCDRVAGSEAARRECSHGLGHGLWFRLPYREALTYCDAMDSIAAAECRDGVFMQRSGSAEHSSHAAHSAHAAHDVQSLRCQDEPARYRHACWHYQAWLVVAHGYPAAFATCDGAADYVDDCYWGLGKWIAWTSASDDEIPARCSRGQRLGACLAGAAEHLIDKDWTTARAERLCRASPAAGRAACDATVAERKTIIAASVR
jgi:hypothetical protein